MAEAPASAGVTEREVAAPPPAVGRCPPRLARPAQTPVARIARARIGTVRAFSPAMFSRESPTM